MKANLGHDCGTSAKFCGLDIQVFAQYAHVSHIVLCICILYLALAQLSQSVHVCIRAIQGISNQQLLRKVVNLGILCLRQVFAYTKMYVQAYHSHAKKCTTEHKLENIVQNTKHMRSSNVHDHLKWMNLEK